MGAGINAGNLRECCAEAFCGYIEFTQEVELELKRPNSTVRNPDVQFYVVGKRGRDGGTFRSSSSGQFSARVMSDDAFRSASGKANTAIREALTHAPKVLPQSKK